jgi:rhomboid protease GluP
VGSLYGAGRMIIIYTVAGVVGFLLSSVAGLYLMDFPIPFLRGAYITVGASAPIFGLLGALVYYGRRTGSSHIGSAGLQYAAILGIFGLIFPGVDNYAHLGGFLGGYLASMVLDPLTRERIDHLAIAVGCLVVTFAAVIWSVVTALPYFT